MDTRKDAPAERIPYDAPPTPDSAAERTYYLTQYDHRQRLARARQRIPLQVVSPAPMVRPSLLWGGAAALLIAYPLSMFVSMVAFWVAL